MTDDDEPDGFDKDGYPDKMAVFIGRSKYDNGDVDIIPEDGEEMIEEELPKMNEHENNEEELEEDEDDDEKEDEYDQWLEEDK